MKNPLNNINKEELLEDAGTLLSASFSDQDNFSKKWELYQKAEQLKKIYREIVKWETMTRGY